MIVIKEINVSSLLGNVHLRQGVSLFLANLSKIIF